MTSHSLFLQPQTAISTDFASHDTLTVSRLAVSTFFVSGIFLPRSQSGLPADERRPWKETSVENKLTMSADLADAIVQAAERMKTQEDRSSYGALYYEKRVQTGFITGAPVREYCFRGANGRVYQEFR